VPSLPSAINENSSSSRRGCTEDLADIATITHISTGITDTNNAIGRSDIRTGLKALGDIADPGDVEIERNHPRHLRCHLSTSAHSRCRDTVAIL
jgi:hypothetical protein